MIWRTDTPNESPIVAYRKGSNTPEILVFAQGYYYDIDCHEVTIGKIQKWASLSEMPTPSNLDEAAEDSWAKYEYRESPRGLYSTCYVDGFKAGAEWAEQGYTTEETVYANRWTDVNEVTVSLGWGEPEKGGFNPGDRVIIQIRKK